MCPHTSLYASSYYSVYVSSYYYICVRILLYSCPHTTVCVLILLHMHRCGCVGVCAGGVVGGKSEIWGKEVGAVACGQAFNAALTADMVA
jgi:hypothetical protein